MTYEDVIEEAILARQDWRDIMEDADDLGDDCANCKMLELCQQAADSHGMYPFPACPYEERRIQDELVLG